MFSHTSKSVFALSAVASSLVLAAALPAAADSRTAQVSVNGALKARADYNDGANQLCAKAFNAVNGATAYASITTPATGQIDVADNGGDNSETCRNLPASVDNYSGYLRVTFSGTGGTVVSDVVGPFQY
ncbi:hypothetical protein [Nocardioides plantarum]|uniref:Uncharacterized protein n=1 Tax=Nocardioides plantarum TaxID=29299 RepID=A0ABV5KBA7_9ACTN|nr:hypothetical protein [Nocardioides plantarum]